ncbi:hypothetical protein [Parvularcula sp. IMCC14364]|uniref:hypothetical protein n=1 Tax=Parvularcula sp. IMCC14364 TaxID=3067902 RepID=UPI002741BE10|nr:hypothetical protein [Parvularcula sp. IMCC14364]
MRELAYLEDRLNPPTMPMIAAIVSAQGKMDDASIGEAVKANPKAVKIKPSGIPMQAKTSARVNEKFMMQLLLYRRHI